MILTKQLKKTNKATPDMKINGKHFKGIGVLSWHKKHSPYYQLSPYYLKTKEGYIFENYWQGLKVYPTVTKQENYTHYTKKGDDRFLVWKHPYEKHIDENGEILPAYFKWRQKLFENPKAVRYPNGFQGRHRCVYALTEEKEKLGYVECRKKVYFTKYIQLIRETDIYKELLKEFKAGQNLIIYEIDVPAEGKPGKYGQVLKDGFYHCTEEKLLDLLNSPEAAFGHGLCLAYALLTDKKNK